MKFISTLKAERSIAQLLAERDMQAPEARKALESLRKLGPTVIPKMIDAFATAERDQMSALAQMLSAQVSDATLKEVAAGLRHGNARCVSGTVAALVNASGYDPNPLLALLGNDEVSAAALVDVLRAQKQRINLRELLRRAYDLEPRAKAAAFRIIADGATPELIPELLEPPRGQGPLSACAYHRNTGPIQSP